MIAAAYLLQGSEQVPAEPVVLDLAVRMQVSVSAFVDPTNLNLSAIALLVKLEFWTIEIVVKLEYSVYYLFVAAEY